MKNHLITNIANTHHSATSS